MSAVASNAECRQHIIILFSLISPNPNDLITAQTRTGLCLRAGRRIQRRMVHARASLVGVILPSQIMTVSRFQNVPETMILH